MSTGVSSSSSSSSSSHSFSLHDLVDKVVCVITCDGRNIIGTLKGFDQTINIILEQSHERVFSLDSGVVQNVLGLYLIRGDNIALIGEFDEEMDSKVDLNNVRGFPIKPVTH